MKMEEEEEEKEKAKEGLIDTKQRECQFVNTTVCRLALPWHDDYETGRKVYSMQTL
jgi:hypothetical protein